MGLKRVRFPLAGSVVVVSGAGSGIGRAFAIRMARQGSPVAIIDRDAEALEATADAVDGRVLARVLDVRDGQGQHAFAAEVARWAPAPIGMVFNNAGVWVAQDVADGSAEHDEWLRAINYDGVVHGVRAFLPLLLRQRSGTIVNCSSVFGLMGVPSQTAYCASKFAVRGFTDALRQELRGSGVRVATVHPGGIRTNIVVHGRVHADPAGRNRDRDRQISDHEAESMTSADDAARIIQRGVERGRARILIGPDARLIDLATRLSPTHAFSTLQRLHTFRARRSASRSVAQRRQV